MPRVNLSVLIVLGVLFAGCDRTGSTSPSGVTAPPSASTPAPPAAAAPATQPAADSTAADATTSNPAADARAAAARAGSGARSAVDPAAGADTQPAASAPMTADQAKGLLNQAMQYVKENKYELAEKTLDQVEAHKASLPATIQNQLGAARSALNTAKAGGGIKIPGLGGQ